MIGELLEERLTEPNSLAVLYIHAVQKYLVYFYYSAMLVTYCTGTATSLRCINSN